MKKIVLKNESCIGCGACVGIDSEHFEFSDEGYSVIKSQENLNSLLLQDAIDACPVAIISLEETDEETEAVKTEESGKDERDVNCECGKDHECNCVEDHECNCDEECHCHENNDSKTEAA